MAPDPQARLRTPSAPGVRTGAWLSAVSALVLTIWTADRLAGRRGLGLASGRVVSTSCAQRAGDGVAEDVGHLVLEGCRLDLDRATVVTDGFAVEAVYTPLRVADGPTLGDIPVLLRLDDPRIRAALQEFLRLNPAPDPTAWFAEHIDPLFGELDGGTIDGTVLTGRRRSATDQDHYSRHRDRFGEAPVLLAPRDRLPSPWPTGLSALAFAILAVWGLLFPPVGIVAGTGRGTGRG